MLILLPNQCMSHQPDELIGASFRTDWLLYPSLFLQSSTKYLIASFSGPVSDIVTPALQLVFVLYKSILFSSY